MDFDAFIADCRVQWPDFDDPRYLSSSEHPRDRYLAGLPNQIRGMATENKLMLLNLVVKHLAADEVYVEIGCWRGLTLAGAAFGYPHVNIYACDNFSEFRGPREALMQTLQRHTAPGQVRFYDMDFRQFLDLAPWQPARVGGYFYDGGHTFEEHLHALEYILPHLANDAIVVVDDTNDDPVRPANRLFASRVPSFHLIADIQTPADSYPTWWNGIQIYHYRRKTVDCPEALIELVTSLLDNGRTDEALSHLHRIVADYPDSADAYRRLGEGFYQNGQIGEAIQAFERAITLDPYHTSAYIELATIWWDEGKREKAIALLQQAILRLPDSIDILSLLSTVLLETGDVERSIRYLEKLAELTPNDAHAHNTLGQVLYKVGQVAKAEKALLRAYVLDPDSAEVHSNLSVFYWEQGNSQSAVEHIQRAAQLDPQSPDVVLNYAMMQEATEEGEQAMQLLEGYLAIHEDAAVRQELERIRQKRQIFQQIYAGVPDRCAIEIQIMFLNDEHCTVGERKR